MTDEVSEPHGLFIGLSWKQRPRKQTDTVVMTVIMQALSHPLAVIHRRLSRQNRTGHNAAVLGQGKRDGFDSRSEFA